MNTRHLKILLIVIALIVSIPVLELGYFAWVLSRPVTVPTNLEVDSIVVFHGSTRRVQAGYEIAQSLDARFLIITPALESELAIFDKKRASNKWFRSFVLSHLGIKLFLYILVGIQYASLKE